MQQTSEGELTRHSIDDNADAMTELIEEADENNEQRHEQLKQQMNEHHDEQTNMLTSIFGMLVSLSRAPSQIAKGTNNILVEASSDTSRMLGEVSRAVGVPPMMRKGKVSSLLSPSPFFIDSFHS